MRNVARVFSKASCKSMVCRVEVTQQLYQANGWKIPLRTRHESSRKHHEGGGLNLASHSGPETASGRHHIRTAATYAKLVLDPLIETTYGSLSFAPTAHYSQAWDPLGSGQSRPSRRYSGDWLDCRRRQAHGHELQASLVSHRHNELLFPRAGRFLQQRRQDRWRCAVDRNWTRGA